ncbi:MAG: glycosyltransferase [Bacteroidota bacterium]
MKESAFILDSEYQANEQLHYTTVNIPYFFPKFEPENQTMESGQSGHILYLPRWYPSRTDPMSGLFVRKHALAAVAAGFRVTVVFVVPGLILKKHELFSIEIQSEDRLTEVFIIYRKAEGISGLSRQLIAWNLGVKTAVQLNGKPDLIHAHILTRTALLAWYYGRKWHLPYLITEHWSRYYTENFQYKGWFRKILTRFAVRNASKTTVVSARLANAMKVAGVGRDFINLPNVVDTQLFNISEKRDQRARIVSITCFEEKSKNLKMLVDAFALLIADCKDAELVLIGEGMDLEMIRTYAAEKRLPPGSVRFTGMLEGSVLAEELSQSSCLAISSNYETFGIVAFEALSSGIPVVATDVADLADFIKPDSGRIVPVGDIQAFTGALTDVLENPARFHPIDMRSGVEQQFGPEAVSQRLSDLYFGIIYRHP